MTFQGSRSTCLIGFTANAAPEMIPASKTRPSDFFKRNCWISFEPVEGGLSVLADYIGPHKIVWATDYPHSDGFFPGARR